MPPPTTHPQHPPYAPPPGHPPTPRPATPPTPPLPHPNPGGHPLTGKQHQGTGQQHCKGKRAQPTSGRPERRDPEGGRGRNTRGGATTQALGPGREKPRRSRHDLRGAINGAPPSQAEGGACAPSAPPNNPDGRQGAASARNHRRPTTPHKAATPTKKTRQATRPDRAPDPDDCRAATHDIFSRRWRPSGRPNQAPDRAEPPTMPPHGSSHPAGRHQPPTTPGPRGDPGNKANHVEQQGTAPGGLAKHAVTPS
ncbi:proline-rich protein 2-like [Acanthochromis polyacanthus]|uniref:proline-rich protein 2-like n=1 Tax=Acanthochromis polyacanthus TaxID=80966 RepID=UPI002234B007|nr:proline-rich protein 2-like [Acanthochromis polyacanthus]